MFVVLNVDVRASRIVMITSVIGMFVISGHHYYSIMSLCSSAPLARL